MKTYRAIFQYTCEIEAGTVWEAAQQLVVEMEQETPDEEIVKALVLVGVEEVEEEGN